MRESQLLKLLRQARPLFVMLDGARAGDFFVRLLSRDGAQVRSLYDSREGDELRGVAPHLVVVGQGSVLLERLVEEGWGHAWGLYLSSDRPLDEVLKHLQNFVKVKTEDEEVLYFRFYDPRVLRVFLPTCTPEQLKEFFGPISAFWVEAEDPNTCLVFRRDKGGLVTETVDLQK